MHGSDGDFRRRTGRGAWRAAAAAASACAVALTACSGESGGEETDFRISIELPDLSGENVEVAAVWTGAEQENFMRVMEAFEQETGASVTFVSTGDNVATFVGSRVAGGAAPDVVMVPQPGVIQEFAREGWIAPVGDIVLEQLDANYAQGWQDLTTYEGEQYGVYVKAANKSLVWYNTTAFEYAGVEPPQTWDQFVDTAWTLWESGTDAVSVGGADGWTLTDWFENIYLSLAGGEMYDQLMAHEIPWTDPSVTEALTTLGALFGEEQLVVGGSDGALQTDFPNSVTQTFIDLETPLAGMVFEADFVGAVITDSTDAVVGEDAQVFPFPSVGAEPPVVTAGDAAVAVAPDGETSEAQDALLAFLASPDAARIWAAPGGYISPNSSLELDAYPNDVQRGIAQALVEAGNDFRFDMSDQTPAAFGGTTGQGMWQGLQNFLRNPDDVEGAQQYLEAQAERAYSQ
ncbi:ABC transporter substrate-binding protein [Streptomyces sp. 4N509B]|uniref:ABC transporter substrate-binding protein n=1 Tax=Streptomyces sp. 4N509B TaxID=3457413 RepID=UPI003FD59DCE